MLKIARYVRFVLAMLAVALAAVLAGPVSPSWAHAELISSTPADGAALGTAPATCSLTFSDELAAQFVRVALTTPAGSAAVTATTRGATVTMPVADAGPGTYRVAYRVVSADGHPVSGTLTFTVTGTPTASASPSSTAAPSAAESSAPEPSAPAPVVSAQPAAGGTGGDEGGLGRLGFAALGVVALAGAGALFLAVGRGRRS